MINPKYWYRIQNLPIEWTGDQLKEHLGNLKSLASVLQSHTVNIRSLATDNRRTPGKQVAIVSFRAIELGHKESISQNQSDTNGYYASIRLDPEFSGLTPLCGLSEVHRSQTGVDIIFVHGLGGHAINSFLYREDDFTHFWPLERLSTDIPWAQNLDDLANSFADCLCIDQSPGQRRRAYILIGVSLGGLIIKSAITKLRTRNKDDILRRIAHLVMFAVPSHGMDIKNLRKIVGEQPNEALIHSLDQSSQVLSYLRDNFAKAFPYTDSKVYSFYETEKTKELQDVNGKLEPTDDPPVRLVTKESATHGRWQSESGDEFVRPINKDHRNIVKFDDCDPHLDNVMLVLRECSEYAPAIVQNRFATILSHQVMCQLKIPRTISNSPPPFHVLTLDLMKKYCELYQALPQDDDGTVTFSNIRDILTDTHGTLSHEPKHHQNHHDYCLPPSSVVEQTWKRINQKTSSLDENLTMAFLFLIHLHQNGVLIPAKEFKPNPQPGTSTLFKRERYSVLKRFNVWTSCQCRPSCPLEWNFANVLGMSRPVGRSADAMNVQIPLQQDTILPRPLFPSSSVTPERCELKKHLENRSLLHGYEREQIFDKTLEEWFKVGSASASGS